MGLFTILARYVSTLRWVLLQTLQRNIVSLKRSWLFSPSTQPDAWIAHKHYLHPSRLFRPKARNNASQLPIVITVHGGGFVMNLPSADDPLARYLADEVQCNVISIDYRKAPLHRFPGAYEDVVTSILTIIEAHSGSSSIILFGSSAGGNLVLSAAQDTRLQGKLHGVVALYPVVNMVPSWQEQMAQRPDPSIPDFLGENWNNILDLYVGSNDLKMLKDRRLSPIHFEKRDALPEHIFMIGCEHDMLCHEAEMMAEKLTASSAPRAQSSSDWQAENVRWTLIKGQTHGFDQFSVRSRDDEVRRIQQRDALYRDIAEWLKTAFKVDET